MSDPFEILTAPDRRVEPDAAFRAQLMDELSHAFSEGATVPVAIGTGEAAVIEVAEVHSMAGHRRLRSYTLLVATAAVIVALGSVLMLRERWTVPPPANAPVATTLPPVSPTTTPPTTTPPTTTPPTTTPYDPVGDALIARSILLEAEEYAPNFAQIDFKDVVLDRAIAEDVPGCSAFLDAVFESPDRQAVTSWRSFFSPLPAILSEYVVVFPTETAAEAMFDGIADPTFLDGCFQPYFDVVVERNGDFCCDPDVAGPPPILGQPVLAAETFGADDVQLRASEESYTNETGVHGPETFLKATVRVGRAIVIIEAITKDEFGNPVITEDQFHAAITTTVTKARAALEGQA
jgi:hypothetical protein